MSPTRLTARLGWILPVFFAALCLHQVKVAYDLAATKTDGTSVEAEVLETKVSRRVDVTYDYLSLRIPLPNGETMTKERLTLPHSLVPALKDKKTLQVRVRPGAAREVVVTETIGSTMVVDTQRRIATMNGAISFVAALLFGVGVFFWNRNLDRSGDPAERGVTEPDPDHPARQVLR